MLPTLQLTKCRVTTLRHNHVHVVHREVTKVVIRDGVQTTPSNPAALEARVSRGDANIENTQCDNLRNEFGVKSFQNTSAPPVLSEIKLLAFVSNPPNKTAASIFDLRG